MNTPQALAALVACVVLMACTSQKGSVAPPEANLTTARDKLAAGIEQCNQTYHYDPKETAGIAENALAPQELQWRQCAYDAVRAYAQSNPPLRGMYEQLIAEDISMTMSVQQGAMTRSQRHARIEQLLRQIRAAEDEQMKASAIAQQQRDEELRRMVDVFRGFSGSPRPGAL